MLNRDEGGVPDRCEPVRSQLQELEQRASGLQKDIQTARGPRRESLVSMFKASEAEIKLRQADLDACTGGAEPPAPPEPQLTDPHVFGSEITEGLPEYELVAGKDTLARVFVGIQIPEVLAITAADLGEEGLSIPAGLHFDQPIWGASRLDYASLEVTNPSGFRFQVPATMSGEFTNVGRSVSEEDNVNFFIDGDLLSRTGQYAFVARFYRDGNLVGTHSFGSRQFLDTADLRLLVKVNTYPMSEAAWDTVIEALHYLQRNLPVRAGVAPMDSDLSAGLRFFVDPQPYDSGWPEWTEASAALTEFNQRQASQGRPDRADKLLNVRTQQPGESPLGGVGQDGGTIAGAILNVNPPGDTYYATVVSQEIGHNFTLDHGPAAIVADTVFDMMNRRALSAVQSIMYNPVGRSEACLFNQRDWRTIRQGLLQLNSSGPT